MSTPWKPENPEPDWDCCDWCDRGSCAGAPTYPKCGGPTGPGIDEPDDERWP